MVVLVDDAVVVALGVAVVEVPVDDAVGVAPGVAGVGGRDLARRPCDELDAQSLLKRGDGPRGGRLG